MKRPGMRNIKATMSKFMAAISTFSTNLRSGILDNLFYYVNLITDSEEEGLLIIPEFVRIFISLTNGDCYIEYNSFLDAEINYLNSICYYLYMEAPLNEQNMYMLAELLDADIKSEDSDTSDLDLLFFNLKSKNENHIAVKAFEKYKQRTGESRYITESCRARMSPMFSNETSLFAYLSNVESISRLAKSIIINISGNDFSSIPHSDIESTAVRPEVLLLSSALAFIYEKVDSNGQYVETLIRLFDIDSLDKLLGSQDTEKYRTLWQQFYEEFLQNTSEEQRVTVAESIKLRLLFLKEYYYEDRGLSADEIKRLVLDSEAKA